MKPLDIVDPEDEVVFMYALKSSVKDQGGVRTSEADDENEELQLALAASLAPKRALDSDDDDSDDDIEGGPAPKRALDDSDDSSDSESFFSSRGLEVPERNVRARTEVSSSSTASSSSSSAPACVICSDTIQAMRFTCDLGHAYCIDCADAFAHDALGKPATVLAQAQGIPCSCCPSAVPLAQLPADILVPLASALSFALCPVSDNRPTERVFAALLLHCPHCTRAAVVDYTRCITQTCECGKSFCGGCLQPNCHDSHNKTGDIYDKKARRKENDKIIHAQLLAVFRDLASKDREPALAALTPHLPKSRLHALTQAVRLL